jgi:hypothetical protein
MHIGSPQSALYVSLWPHSEILGFVPSKVDVQDINTDSGSSRTGAYILASDTSFLPGPRPGRGHGALQKDDNGGQVVVPSAHTLLEAYIRLSAAYRYESHGAFYMSMINYVVEYIDTDGLLNVGLLPEPCRLFWDELKKYQLSLWELCDQFEANIAASKLGVGHDSNVEMGA